MKAIRISSRRIIIDVLGLSYDYETRTQHVDNNRHVVLVANQWPCNNEDGDAIMKKLF